jgi:hypothetical protein
VSSTPNLYRVVEVFRHSDSAITRVAPVWQASLAEARKAAARLPVSVNCLRVCIEDAKGRVVEQLYADRPAR